MTRTPVDAPADEGRPSAVASLRPAAVRDWFLDAWDDIDRDRRPAAFGRFEAGLLLVVAVAMVLQQFPSRWDSVQGWISPSATWFGIADQLQWAFVTIAAYVVLPVAYLKATGRSLAAFNLPWRGTARHLRVYVLLAVLVSVPLLLAATNAQYERIYPFYELAGRSWADLLLWEAVYAAQFVALEFFFRGVMVEGLRPVLGHGAIFVMVVPYCMLHFGKTGSEALAAIVAGIVLGTMAMRWRSIWGGALLHIWVAVAMDVAVLTRGGEFPPQQLVP